MEIKFGNIVLCAESETPKSFSASLRRRIQSDDIILSAKPNVSDRGNESRGFSFGIERIHKNPKEAEKALFNIMDEISQASPARLEIKFIRNASSETLVFENAALSKCVGGVDGRITTHMLEFSAGKKERL